MCAGMPDSGDPKLADLTGFAIVQRARKAVSNLLLLREPVLGADVECPGQPDGRLWDMPE